jgi:hypothetical protein
MVVSGVRMETFVGVLIHGLIASLAGIAGMIYLLYLMESRELLELFTAVRRSFFSRTVVPTDEVDTLAR